MKLTFTFDKPGVYKVDGHEQLEIKRGLGGDDTWWYVTLDGALLHDPQRGIIRDTRLSGAQETAQRMLDACEDCGRPKMLYKVRARCYDCGQRHNELMLCYAAGVRAVRVVQERHELAERILDADTDELALTLANELIR